MPTPLTEINKELLAFQEGLKKQSLYDPVKYILSLDAKRIRPQLVLQAVEVFKGNIKQAIPLALAVEVFHNFTLLHDDIMDNSSLRRGKQTVHQKWNVNSAILSGDAMLILAYQLIGRLPVTKQAAILNEFNKMALLLCEGQQNDLQFEKQPSVTTTAYIEMIQNKTAVLVAFCLKAGAILAGVNEQIQQHIYQFGINLGIAFQLQDDFLDLYPKSTQMGKTIGGDLLNNKKALPLLIALENKQATTKIIPLLIAENSSNKVEKLKIIFNEIQVKEKCENTVTQYYHKANHYLNEIKGFDTKIFSDFCITLQNRQK